jgi:hypothetical protein
MMLADRRDLIRKARSLKTTPAKFESQIKELYRVNRWLKTNKAGKMVAEPWEMLRDFGDRWRNKYPQYDSPWEKRQRNWRDFQARIEKTLARK